MLRTPTRLALPVALLALLVLPGCRPGSALHNRYNNFRAFYNTYYNASRKLKSGEEALRNENAVVDRARLIELFPGTGSGGQTGAFQEAIDKSAELLRNRPSSKWADDALLLIGKAYFYQRNFVGAEQKFRETIDAAAVANDRKLSDEAEFWLGRTMAAGDRFDDGVDVLRTALARSGGDRYWRSRMTLALGELYARAARWDESSETLREGIDAVGSRELQARAYLLLGQVEELAGRYAEAAEAYRQSADVSRIYELTYASKLNEALVLGLDLDESDRALALIRAMARDDKNFTRRAEVALIRGRLLAASGDDDAALQVFRDVLYDRNMGGQSVRGEAHLRLAEFHRDRRGDFILASAHFDTAATALPATVTAAQRPSRTAILGIRDLARTFNTIAGASKKVVEFDSLLTLGDLAPDAFRERVDAIEAVRYAEWLVEQRRADAVRAQQDFSAEGPLVPGSGLGGRPNVAGAGVQTTEAGGFLGYRDVNIVQAGQIAFERTWGDRPLGLNWRRRAALQQQVDGGAVDGEAIATAVRSRSGPPPLDLSGVPRTPEAQARVRLQRSEVQYELGNAFFLSLNRLDRASDLYRQIIDVTPDAPVANRARYALAEVEAAAGRPDAARPIYQALATSVPDGVLGEASRARLEGREPTTAAVVAVDSAVVAFDAAKALWDSGEPRLASTAFVSVGERWPSSTSAPRAFLTGAYAYVSAVGNDSLVLAALLPVDVASPLLASAVPGRTAAAGAGAPQRPVLDDTPSQTSSPAPLPALRGAPAPVGGAPAPVGAQADDIPIKRGQESAGAAPNAGVAPVPPVASTPTPASAADTSGTTPVPALAAETSAPTQQPDSPQVELRLKDYLRGLAARYPGTPSAARATALSAFLPDPPAPIVVVDTTTATDSTAIAAAVDSTTAGTDSTAVARSVPVAAEGSVKGPEPIDFERGGFTWKAQVYATQMDANLIVGPLLGAGFRVAIAQSSEEVFVIVGQFESAEAAERARYELPAWMQVRGTVIPMADFEVLDAGLPPADGKENSSREE